MLTHKGTRPIHTARLLLRPMDLGDAADMFSNYASDAEVTRFLSWPPYESVEQVEEYLEGVIPRYEDESFYYWAICLEGHVIGSVSVIDWSQRNECCELGYALGSAYWSRGYMSEAVGAMMDYLFREVGMGRISAKHDVDNPASGRVMEKCGMRPEGHLRGHYLRRDGSRGDCLIYGALSRDFV